MFKKVLVIGLILIGVVSAAAVLAAPAQQEFTGQKWQYLTLTYDIEAGTAFALLSDLTATEQLNATLDSMELPPSTVGDNEFANPLYFPTVLDYLGQQGWELSQSGVFNAGNFIFKRPI